MALASAVARIAVDDDLGAGIEPAHIIRSRPHDLDPGVGKSHGSQPLTGMAFDFHMNRIISGLPEPAADAVLAKGLDVRSPVAGRQPPPEFVLPEFGNRAGSPSFFPEI